MKRKLLTALLTAAMLMTLTPTAALAAEPGDGPESGNGAVVTGSEPGGENGDNETPTPQPNLAPTTDGSDSAAPSAGIGQVTTWEALVDAIEGGSTRITLDSDVTRGENDEVDIVISEDDDVTIDLLGWTLNGGGQGPVITVEEGGKLTIEDTSIDRDGKITGGEADYGGGIYVDGGTLTMTSGAISGNKAKSGGGVYLTNGATFTMTGGEISENSLTNTSGKGGGVYVGTDCTFTINAETLGDAVIKDNVALGRETSEIDWYQIQTAGGGIAVNKGTLNLTNAEITGNRATDKSGNGAGGGIYAYKSTVTIRDSKISNNLGFISDENYFTECGGGGIKAANDTVLVMSGTEVSGNKALQGAGLYLYSITSASIDNCEIKDNHALLQVPNNTGESYFNDSVGGGILLQTSGGSLTPPNLGGDDDDEPAPAPEYALTITNSTISGNTAAEGGGGIFVYSGTMKVENTPIEKNESPQGGGIHSQGTAVLTNCTLSENDGSGAGGALSVSGGTMTLTGCTVQQNTSNGEQGWGGGAYVAGELILENTQIIENQADNTGYGGGVFVNGGGQLTIDATSKIDSNTATEAAGVYNGGTVTMNGGSISDNSAAGMAGGVENANYQDSNDVIHPAVFTMNDGDISNNTAVTSAGGVANVGTFEMKGGTITGNQATQKAADDDEIAQDIGVGGGVVNYGTFTMTGGAIYGNEAATGGNDFYNYAEEADEGEGEGEGGGQSGGIDVDDSWEGDHNMGLESLSASRAGDTYGTFTLIPATDFGYSGWFEDEPKKRYTVPGSTEEYEVTKEDTSLQYLTLGEPLTAYHVVYAFVSADKNASLPDEVTALLPVDNDTYAKGATVTAIQPENIQPENITVTVDGVTWTFEGYNEDSQVVNDDNLVQPFDCNGDDRYISFVGTWTTKEKNGEP